jgi:serine/threonine protein kinase
LDNIFVNYAQGEGDVRFTDVQLGDLGGCYPADSHWATSGTMVGAPIWNSPEIMFEEKWNTATDIWSFGAVVSTLLWSASTAAEIC